jgi:hypothetical protein
MNAPVKTLCCSGGPKHKIHSEHGIVFLNRSVKILNLAVFLGMLIFTVLQGCKMKILTDQVLRLLNAKSVFISISD